MAVPLMDLNLQHAQLGPKLRHVFGSLLATGQFILGPEVQAFETELASWCGAGHAVGMSSGTDALIAAMMALDIGPGDEVITSPFTFFATAGTIARLGARPVFVDIDPATFNLDPSRLEAAITGRTRAIMPVHLFGQMAEMEPILQIAGKRNLHVIEDACQAIGAADGAHRSAAASVIGCLSFYPTKNLAAVGDAGACLTSDPALAKRLQSLRAHGSSGTYDHQEVGGNFRLDAVQAAVLRVKLPHLEAWTRARQARAARYNEELAGLEGIVTPRPAAGKQHVYNQYTLRVGAGRRDALIEHLQKKQIGNRVYYPQPLHLQPCFAGLGYKRGDFAEAERAANEVVSLPIFPEMTEAQQSEVIGAIREFAG